MLAQKWLLLSKLGNDMIATDSKIKNLQKTAQSVFAKYSLSPEDRDEAVAQYVRIGGNQLMGENKTGNPAVMGTLEGATVERILYSMYCEHVWRRDTRTDRSA